MIQSNQPPKRNIAVVCGGYHGEYEVSLRSAQGIMAHLDPTRYNTYQVVIDPNEWYALTDGRKVPVDKNTFSLQSPAPGSSPIPLDYAFITIHGTPGEDGLLQGYLDMLHIPYNTGGVLCESLTFDKEACKAFLSTYGVRTSPACKVASMEDFSSQTAAVQALGLPVFVKPNQGGSSIATTKVSSPEELTSAVSAALQEGAEALIERLITGTEVTCGCLCLAGSYTPIAVTEVVAHTEFFDFNAKYNGLSDEITPARLDSTLYTRIEELTCRIARLLNARGIIRIDYIIEPDGIPTLLEVNTTPGMTPASFIPQQVAYKGLLLDDLFTRIIESSFAR